MNTIEARSRAQGHLGNVGPSPLTLSEKVEILHIYKTHYLRIISDLLNNSLLPLKLIFVVLFAFMVVKVGALEPTQLVEILTM